MAAIARGGLQGAHRLAPRTRHPARFGLASCDRKDGLGPADAHLAGADRSAQQSPLAKPTRKPYHFVRGARRDSQPFTRVVADARIPEPEHAIADAERVEPFSDGDVKRPATPRGPHEERVDHPHGLVTHGLVALSRQRPLEKRRGCSEFLERFSETGARRIHRVLTVPEGSDMPARALMAC